MSCCYSVISVFLLASSHTGICCMWAECSNTPSKMIYLQSHWWLSYFSRLMEWWGMACRVGQSVHFNHKLELQSHFVAHSSIREKGNVEYWSKTAWLCSTTRPSCYVQRYCHLFILVLCLAPRLSQSHRRCDWKLKLFVKMLRLLNFRASTVVERHLP